MKNLNLNFYLTCALFQILKLASVGGIKPLHLISTLSVFEPTQCGFKITEKTKLGNGQHLMGGYAQSKWVADKLAFSAHAAGVPTSIYRLGYVSASSTTGASNELDSFNMIVRGM
jgi:thioester reductase-like protein